jgi:hypothetical protein
VVRGQQKPKVPGGRTHFADAGEEHHPEPEVSAFTPFSERRAHQQRKPKRSALLAILIAILAGAALVALGAIIGR